MSAFFLIAAIGRQPAMQRLSGFANGEEGVGTGQSEDARAN
jgi:hypothetical protein